MSISFTAPSRIQSHTQQKKHTTKLCEMCLCGGILMTNWWILLICIWENMICGCHSFYVIPSYYRKDSWKQVISTRCCKLYLWTTFLISPSVWDKSLFASSWVVIYLDTPYDSFKPSKRIYNRTGSYLLRRALVTVALNEIKETEKLYLHFYNI